MRAVRDCRISFLLHIYHQQQQKTRDCVRWKTVNGMWWLKVEQWDRQSVFNYLFFDEYYYEHFQDKNRFLQCIFVHYYQSLTILNCISVILIQMHNYNVQNTKKMYSASKNSKLIKSSSLIFIDCRLMLCTRTFS